MSINKAFISGNIGKEPELKRTQSGMAILRFSVAVNDRTRDKQTGEWTDYTNWIDCVMFGNRAESLDSYLSKGSKVSVEGKLRWSSWDGKDGKKKSKVEVVVDEVEFMSKGGQKQQQQPQQQQQSLYDDDCPF